MDSSPTSHTPAHTGDTSCSEWVTEVTERHAVGDWTELTVKQRKQSLLQLCKPLSGHKVNVEKTVQYVTEQYPGWSVEDLEGNECLLVHLSTPLAVKVLKEHCSVPFSLACVPSLMKQGISSSTLEKILKASKEQTVGKSQKYTAAPAATNTVGGIQADGGICSDGAIQAEGVQTEASDVPEDSHSQVQKFLGMVLKEGFGITFLELDIYCHTILSQYGPKVNLNRCRTVHGNLLHAASKFGLAQSAKEALAQGYYKMLLENDEEKGIKWPLYYAVEKGRWSTVKIFLETLSCSQRQAQMKVIRNIVPIQTIMEEVKQYQKPWWVWSPLHSENVETKAEMEGKVLLLQAVLDTTMRGNDVDAALVLGYSGEQVGTISTDDGSNSTSEEDGSPAKQPRKSLYELVTDCGIEELQCHPCVATVIEYKWRSGYGIIHGLLFSIYLLYLFCFTMSLGLAARSSDPREYSGRWDPLRLICEIASFLYLIVVIVMEVVVLLHLFCDYRNAEDQKHSCFLIFMEVVSIHNFFEALRYVSTLLIIPLRIADNPFQWQMAALAIILSGFRLFRYATVLPYFGSYVGTLFLLLRQDVPRLIGLFVVINFSLGSGLYFALVGHYDDNNVDIVNDNSTSEVYRLWLTGVRLVVEDSFLTYTGPDGFNFSGVVIYWMLVFCVSIVFTAILIAQFDTSYNQLADRAHMNVILKKIDRMKRTDQLLCLVGTFLKYIGCVKGDIKLCLGGSDERRTIKRKVLHDPDRVNPKDFIVDTLCRKLAENDKRVEQLEGKLDEVHALLKEMNSNFCGQTF